MVGTFSYPGLSCHGELKYVSARRNPVGGGCEFTLAEHYISSTGCTTEDAQVLLKVSHNKTNCKEYVRAWCRSFLDPLYMPAFFGIKVFSEHASIFK